MEKGKVLKSVPEFIHIFLFETIAYMNYTNFFLRICCLKNFWSNVEFDMNEWWVLGIFQIRRKVCFTHVIPVVITYMDYPHDTYACVRTETMLWANRQTLNRYDSEIQLIAYVHTHNMSFVILLYLILDSLFYFYRRVEFDRYDFFQYNVNQMHVHCAHECTWITIFTYAVWVCMIGGHLAHVYLSSVLIGHFSNSGSKRIYSLRTKRKIIFHTFSPNEFNIVIMNSSCSPQVSKWSCRRKHLLENQLKSWVERKL